MRIYIHTLTTTEAVGCYVRKASPLSVSLLVLCADFFVHDIHINMKPMIVCVCVCVCVHACVCRSNAKLLFFSPKNCSLLTRHGTCEIRTKRFLFFHGRVG